MKVTVYEDNNDEIVYPCLMCCRKGGVVLFTSAGYGTRLRKGYAGDAVGFVDNDWHMDDYTPFNGVITLEND